MRERADHSAAAGARGRFDGARFEAGHEIWRNSRSSRDPTARGNAAHAGGGAQMGATRILVRRRTIEPLRDVKTMRILMISAEAPPLQRKGALIVVMNALPHELSERGYDLCVAHTLFGA